MIAKERLTQFSTEQRKFVLARLLTTSDAAAARAVGLHPSTVCKWPNKAELDAAVVDLLGDRVAQAVECILDAVPDAARIKAAGLKSKKETVKQASASEILDRGLGKAVARYEHGSDPERPVKVNVNLSGLSNDELDTLAGLARRVQGDRES